MAWGVTLLIFGSMFLLRQLNIIPHDIAILFFDFKNYPIIAGIIFLLLHANKTIGWVLLAVGVLLRLHDIIRWTQDISDFIWPLLLIIAGGILIFGAKKG